MSNVYKGIRRLYFILDSKRYWIFIRIMMWLNGVRIEKCLIAYGFPRIIVTRKGKVRIGTNFRMNSGQYYNVIGRQQKCILWVDGNLCVGNNVGISATAIICKEKITIGNNVIIGGNTVIYDSNFHSLNSNDWNSELDQKHTLSKEVIIGDNVFIGAHSTILKGVNIGRNSVVGASSVVTKSIPANEMWAGNPAQFIRKII
jgi:acetyltransferase-like isoleucine patch superfamily enzyme